MTIAPENRKLTGFAHFFAAAGYAAGGFARAWKEAAFRQEIGAGVVLAAIYMAVGVDMSTALAALILFLVLIAFEAINTAIEDIVDRISPEVSLTAKHAKDLGSFAVLCLLVANGGLLARVLYSAVVG